MPIVPFVYVSRRITVEKQGRARRIYACGSCGYRAEIEVTAAARAASDGSLVAPRDRIETEAHERADAALADEMQDLFDLIPCPECGGRSENAGLYQQNTILAMVGCILASAAVGAYAYLGTPANRTGLASPLAALLYTSMMGIALTGACWHRRSARISYVARAVQFFPAEEEAAAPPAAVGPGPGRSQQKREL